MRVCGTEWDETGQFHNSAGCEGARKDIAFSVRCHDNSLHPPPILQCATPAVSTPVVCGERGQTKEYGVTNLDEGRHSFEDRAVDGRESKYKAVFTVGGISALHGPRLNRVKVYY